MVAFLVGLVIFLPSVVSLGRWILGPIDRAARAREAPVQYSIADFLCLFVIIQIPLAGAFQFSRNDDPYGLYWFLIGLTWIAAPVIWVVATRALSRAGIRGGKHRLAFMGLIVPVAYYGLLPFVVMTILAVAEKLAPNEQPVVHNSWFVETWFALGVLLLLSGLYTRWMVRHVESNMNHKETEDTKLTISG